MAVTNVLPQLLVSLKTNYNSNNVFAYCDYNLFLLDILFLLYKDGLISGYSIDYKSNKIKIKLKYLRNKPLILMYKLISKPSFQKYLKYSDLQLLNNNFDYFYTSTSTGLLSSRQFTANPKIGGQVLFALKLATV